MNRKRRTRIQAKRAAWKVLWRLRGWISGKRWKDYKLMGR